MAYVQLPIVFQSAPITGIVAGSGISASAGPSVTVALSSSGVVANTYSYPTSITVDTYGRTTAITAGSQPGMSGSALFGDGSDGNVTISVPTTLTRDMYYNNLVVNSNLNTAGARIFVKGTLSGTGGIISNNGGDASSFTHGNAAGTITLGGGFIGGDGGNIGGAGSGGDGPSPTQWVGGSAGSGGTGTAGGGGITATNRPLQNMGGRTITISGSICFPYWCNPYAGLTGRAITGTLMQGGLGGGGGGGSATARGGGGGGSGGILACFINANTSTNVTFQARGGNGAQGGANAGGGGGAGGGYVYLVYNSANWNPTGFSADANGGSGGAANGTGTAGGNGTNGAVHTIALS